MVVETWEGEPIPWESIPSEVRSPEAEAFMAQAVRVGAVSRQMTSEDAEDEPLGPLSAYVEAQPREPDTNVRIQPIEIHVDFRGSIVRVEKVTTID